MKLSDEAKKDILNCVIDRIAAIADKEYQKRVWIHGKGPEVDDFDETVCHFFQEGDGVLERYKDFGLTETQYLLLKNFRDEFDHFCRGPALKYYLPQAFIDTTEWSKIVEKANEVLEAFNYKKKPIT